MEPSPSEKFAIAATRACLASITELNTQRRYWRSCTCRTERNGRIKTVTVTVRLSGVDQAVVAECAFRASAHAVIRDTHCVITVLGQVHTFDCRRSGVLVHCTPVLPSRPHQLH